MQDKALFFVFRFANFFFGGQVQVVWLVDFAGGPPARKKPTVSLPTAL